MTKEDKKQSKEWTVQEVATETERVIVSPEGKVYQATEAMVLLLNKIATLESLLK